MLIKRHIQDFVYWVDTAHLNEIEIEEEQGAPLLAKGEIGLEQLLHHIADNLRGHRALSVFWQLTRSCNYHCPFCYIRDNSRRQLEATYEEIEELIECLLEEGLAKVVLTGGECLLSEHFDHLYTRLKSEGVLVTIYTNGSLFSESRRALFRKLPPYSVEVTLYDCDVASPPFATIEWLIETGIPVLCKFTATKSNIDHLEAIRQWCDERQVDLRIDGRLFDGDNGIDAQVFSLEESTLIALEKVQVGAVALDRRPLEPHPRKALGCAAAKYGAYVSPEFKLGLCCDHPLLWDMRQEGVRKALRLLHDFVDREKEASLIGCSGCEAQMLCEMCAAKAEIIESSGETIYRVPMGYCDEVHARFLSLAGRESEGLDDN